MTRSETNEVSITKATVQRAGDLLVTFSDQTTVLFPARFLYGARTRSGAIEIVDPFTA